MNLGLWFHKLFQPHCQECKDEIAENKVCESCETLKMQLAIANAEKRAMLDSLLEKPKVEAAPYKPNLEELKPKQMTWNVRRQLLEAEDRKAAELLRKKVSEVPSSNPGQLRQDQVLTNQTQSIESLEKELGVEEADAKPSDLHGQDRAG